MIAVICNSPVQLMRTVYMTLNHIEPIDESVDLYIGMGCPGSEKIYQTVEKTGLFHKVYCLDTRNLGKHQVFKLLYGRSEQAAIIQKEKYDKLIAFNIEDITAQAIYNQNKHNTNFEYHCMEDAPAIYTPYEPSRYRLWHPYHWLGIKQQAYHTDKWWSSCPEWIEVPKNFGAKKERLLPIDKTDEKYRSLINGIFDYNEDRDLENADILIMEESHYTDGLMTENADYKIFTHIQERYSDKNILVKLHPRTKDNRFARTFKVMNNSTIPWELYVLNRIYKNKKDLIQISIACGTMVSDKMMFGEEGKKIILAPIFYDLVKPLSSGVKRITPKITESFEKIKYAYSMPENLVIAYNEKDIYASLDKMFENREE